MEDIEYKGVPAHYVHGHMYEGITWLETLELFKEWLKENYSSYTTKKMAKHLEEILITVYGEVYLPELFSPFQEKNLDDIYNIIIVQGGASLKYIDNTLSTFNSFLKSENTGSCLTFTTSDKYKISYSRKNQEVDVLSEDQVYEIASMFDDRTKCMILLSYHGMLSSEELINLKRRDIDFDRKQLIVRDKEKKYRYDLDDVTLNAIKGYFSTLVDRNIVDDNFLLNKSGKKISNSLLRMVFKDCREKYNETTFDEIKSLSCVVLRNSRRLKLLAVGKTTNEVIELGRKGGFTDVNRLKKLIPAVYPETKE